MIFNPYSRINFLSRRAYHKDMKKYGFEIMREEDRKKMVSALCVMNVRDPEFIPCRCLDQEIKEKGIATKTGIWINPNLSESESNYVRHELAKKVSLNKKDGILKSMMKSCLAMFSLLMGLAALTGQASVPLCNIMLAIASGYWCWKIKKREREREIKSQDRVLNILKKVIESEEKH